MKKILSVILAVVMIFSCFSILSIAAGDSIAAATNISLNTTYSDTFNSASTKNFYAFSIISSGRVRLQINSPVDYLYLFMYDEDGKTVWSSGLLQKESDADKITYVENIDLTYGSYYLSIYNKSASPEGNYSFNLTLKQSNETYIEPNQGNNNSIADADSATINRTYKGQIARNDKYDYYKFAVSSGNVALTFTHNIKNITLYVYRADGSTAWKNSTSHNGGVDTQSTYKASFSLTAGTYYFVVNGSSGNTGNYDFVLSGTSAPAENNPSGIDLSVSKTAMTIKKGESATAIFNYTGYYSGGIKALYKITEKDVISIAWGAWDREHIPVTIKGVAEGQITFTVLLVDSVTNEELDSTSIDITVVSDNSGAPIEPTDPSGPVFPETSTQPSTDPNAGTTESTTEPDVTDETIDFNDFGADDVIIIIKWILRAIKYLVEYISQLNIQ